MFKHVVVSRLKDSAGGRTRAETARFMKEKFEALVGVVPGLLRAEVGIDIFHRDDSSDVILICDFDSRASYEGYSKHPAHQAIVEAIKDARTERRLVDWET